MAARSCSLCVLHLTNLNKVAFLFDRKYCNHNFNMFLWAPLLQKFIKMWPNFRSWKNKQPGKKDRTNYMLYACKNIIGITITIPDITHRSVFYLKNAVSKTGVCLRLKLKLTQLGTIVRTNLWLLERQSPKRCFKQKAGRRIMFRIAIVILIYHRHKPIDSINLLGS
jgi:hypothetical protein